MLFKINKPGLEVRFRFRQEQSELGLGEWARMFAMVQPDWQWRDRPNLKSFMLHMFDLSVGGPDESETGWEV